MARLGLGLASLGRPGYINIGHGADLGSARDRATMERAAHVVLDTAYDAGVRYFDVARSYGLAEAFLASWLNHRGVGIGDVTVASKWGYTYTANWQVDAAVHEVKDHSLRVFTRQFAESRALLGDHLVLYQIHSATLESGVLDDAAVIDALAEVRAAGLRIGLTVSGPRQAEAILRALEIRRAGDRVFDSVQATWNLLERGAEGALAAAHDAGVAVIVKEAVANGRLTARGGNGIAPNARNVLVDEAATFGVPEDALAIACALSRPWVDVVLSGATTVPQLESNLRATSITVSDSTLKRLSALTLDSATYWRERASLPWN